MHQNDIHLTDAPFLRLKLRSNAPFHFTFRDAYQDIFGVTVAVCADL